MFTIVINWVCVAVSGFLGAAAASWLWYSYIRRQSAGLSLVNGAPPVDAGSRPQKLAAQVAADFAVRLQELVTQVAFDVGEHNSQVQEINDELTSSTCHDSTKVLGVVLKLVEANQQMQEKLTSTEQKLRDQTDQMQTLLAETRTDALTLLANRRAFDDELVKRFEEFGREGTSFSLTIVDVDRFKCFNDIYGHRAGDEVLRNVAKVLRRKMRKTDIVARYGGDEFAIAHAGANLADVRKSALRVCEAMEKSQFVYDGQHLPVTVSVGVAEMLSNESASELFQRADSAMYASKEAGRNCVHFHDGKVCRRVRANKETAQSSAALQQRETVPPRHDEEQKKARPPQAAADRSRSDCVAKPEELGDLPGRTNFCQCVRNRMAEWSRGGPAFSIALIAVGRYDDSRGGIDQRTREAAWRVTGRGLLATTREMDVVGSYTPGCFALMMPTARLADAIRVAARLLEELSAYISLASAAQPTFSLSVGVVQAIETDDVTSILKRAEMALDAADRGGGARVYCHDGERVALGDAILAMETPVYLR